MLTSPDPLEFGGQLLADMGYPLAILLILFNLFLHDIL